MRDSAAQAMYAMASSSNVIPLSLPRKCEHTAPFLAANHPLRAFSLSTKAALPNRSDRFARLIAPPYRIFPTGALPTFCRRAASSSAFRTSCSTETYGREGGRSSLGGQTSPQT